MEKSTAENMLKSSLVISYTYKASTGEGLTDNDSQILVDVSDNDIPSVKFLESIDHCNFLPCWNNGIKAKDEWDDSQGNQDKGVVLYRKPYAAIVCTFSEVTIPFLNSYNVPNMANISLKYIYVSEFWRNVMKAMVDFTLYLHDRNKCFAHRLEDRNFLIFDDTLKFCCLRVRDYSSENAKKDFQYIAHIIEDLFASYKLKLPADKSSSIEMPADLKDFIRVLRNYSKLHRLLVKSHLAILSARKRLEQIQRFVTKWRTIPAQQMNMYKKAMREMEMQRLDWTKRFEESHYSFGPAYDVYFFGDRSEKNSDKDNVTIHYENTGRGLLKFCRNVAAHTLEHVDSYLASCQVQLDERDTDLVIMSLFDKELTSFHWKASSLKVLEYLA